MDSMSHQAEMIKEDGLFRVDLARFRDLMKLLILIIGYKRISGLDKQSNRIPENNSNRSG